LEKIVYDYKRLLFNNEMEWSPSIFMITGTVSLFVVLLVLFSSVIILSQVVAFTGYYAFYKNWGMWGSGDGQFIGPLDVVVDHSGGVYVADYQNNRVQKFQLANPCPAGTTQIAAGVCFVTKWGAFGSGDGQFSGPENVAVDYLGRVYVADIGGHRIQMFQLSDPCPVGTTQIKPGVCFVIKWGTPGPGNGQFNYPGGIAVDSSGRVYVTDTGNNNVQKFLLSNSCPAGTTQVVAGVCFVKKWGIPGSGNGQFKNPHGIAVDPSGRLYVADLGNNRIQMFKGNGAFIRAWGTFGSGNGQFGEPRDVTMDNFGRVYVDDMDNHRVQRFLIANPCPAGSPQIKPGVCYDTKLGAYGTGDGEFKFPVATAVDSSERVYTVDDHGSNRIQVFFWKIDTGGTGGPGGGTTEPGIVTNKTDK
jgi:tripartite motif-containing protein 71